jgi:hypothetical protein
MTTHGIVAKLWNLCNVLKGDGVTYHQYVSELTYLLFLKTAQETGTEAQLPAVASPVKLLTWPFRCPPAGWAATRGNVRPGQARSPPRSGPGVS